MSASHIAAALLGFGAGMALTLWITRTLNARRAERNSCTF